MIRPLRTITRGSYHSVDDKPLSSRKTDHQINFENLQGTAAQLVATFDASPALNGDSGGTSRRSRGDEEYCVKTTDTRPVLTASTMRTRTGSCCVRSWALRVPAALRGSPELEGGTMLRNATVTGNPNHQATGNGDKSGSTISLQLGPQPWIQNGGNYTVTCGTESWKTMCTGSDPGGLYYFKTY
jgi:hypothetical protein